jgi:hypothetical protein
VASLEQKIKYSHPCKKLWLRVYFEYHLPSNKSTTAIHIPHKELCLTTKNIHMVQLNTFGTHIIRLKSLAIIEHHQMPRTHSQTWAPLKDFHN